MASQALKDLILLLVFIFINYPKSSNCQCDALPYRQEVKVHCHNPEKGVIDCYSGKLPPGTTARYRCEDQYIQPLVSLSRGNHRRELICDRKRRWSGINHFQLFLCQVDCGIVRVQGYIIGGQPTDAALWPWNAAIFILTESGRFVFQCGGTLIDTVNEGLLVLTAAHCVEDDRRNMRVALGATSSDYETVFRDRGASMFKVKYARRHEKYTPNRDYDNDIALLQLDRPVCLAPNKIPACLPIIEEDARAIQIQTDDLGDVVGFGHYNNTEYITSPRLQHTKLPVAPPENCNVWRFIRKLESSEICAGYLEGEKGTCNGDSGAGLMFRSGQTQGTNLRKYYVQGIVSHGPAGRENGKRCYTYTVFTRVSHFTSWIQNVQFPDDVSTEYYSNGPSKCGSSFPEGTEETPVKFPSEPTNWEFPTISTTSNKPQTTSTTPRSNPPVEGIQIEVLNAHNRYRQSHGVPSLRLSDELNREAQSYADYLIREHIFINLAQPGKNMNKNIYQFIESGQRKDAADIVRLAVDYWYNQKDKYDQNYPRPSTYTQIIWRSTTNIGIGLSSLNGANERRTVVVAAYSPPGNTITPDGRYFRENVPI